MSRGRVVAAIAALLAVGGVATAFAVSSSARTDVTVAEATRGDLAVTVAASGRVEADEKIDLYPPTAGVLETVAVMDGQVVRAGDVIAVMDTGPIEVQLAQAEAAYAGARAQRGAAAKAAPGAADRRAADAAVTAAKSAYDVAKLRYDAARAGLGAPSPADIAEAQAAVAAAEAVAAAARAAYDAFYADVYLPASEPRDPALETALAALGFARDQATANLAAARQALAALVAASDNTAAVAAAKLALDQANAAYLGAVSQRAALEKASSVGAALASADRAITAAETARDLAAATLEAATITAPIDGVVVFNTISSGLPGGPVVAPTVGASVSPAAAPFAIVAFDTVVFVAQVDEADIARVEEGMEAVVSLDGFSGEEFATKVERIEKRSVLTPTGGTAFPVRLRLSNVDDGILLGMNGSVEIQVELVGEAVTVPVEAVLDEAAASYVYVVRDGRAVYAEVELGRFTDTRAEVLSGLEQGEQVIVSGVAELRDGAPVRVK